jgi:putative flippase GtrA
MHFMVSLGIQFLLNALVFSSLLALGIAVWPAQLITTVALTFINYGMYRLWVFA